MMKSIMRNMMAGAFLWLCVGLPVMGQTYTPTSENLKAREEFQDNKFGIFLHWGIYSMTAQGEWYMHNRNINWEEYAKLASGFYPSKFNAAEWVSAIKASGAKYITITSRHHDGFSMFHTKQSDYNIVDATPFKRDIIKELAEECKKQGIKLHFYYSHLDWRRDDYPVNNSGRGTGRPKGKENWKSYYQFMNNQLTELLTNYGPIGAIWFDGVWDNGFVNDKCSLGHPIRYTYYAIPEGDNDRSRAIKFGETCSSDFFNIAKEDMKRLVKVRKDMTNEIAYITELIEKVAKENNIPIQYVTSGDRTWTNADQIHFVDKGIPTMLLNIPLRYMHSSAEVVNMDDVNNLSKLMALVIKEINEDFSFNPYE